MKKLLIGLMLLGSASVFAKVQNEISVVIKAESLEKCQELVSSIEGNLTQTTYLVGPLVTIDGSSECKKQKLNGKYKYEVKVQGHSIL